MDSQDPKTNTPKTTDPSPQSPALAPASTPASTTKPEDLHIPEELPPPMPEEADAPTHPSPSEPVAGTNAPAAAPPAESDQATEQTTETTEATTEPEDLHIPERFPPPMPELADKPDAPPKNS